MHRSGNAFRGCVGFLAGTFLAVLSSRAWADTESVYVAKSQSVGDQAIIVRRDGTAYLIGKGVGCLSLSMYQGRIVLIASPGMFLGVGSKLLLPGNDQECRIWSSKDLGTWAGAIPSGSPDANQPSRVGDDSGAVTAAQKSLACLGYDPGGADGRLGPQTREALKSFQTDLGLPSSGSVNRATLLGLSDTLLKSSPDKQENLQLASELLSLSQGGSSVTGARNSSCEPGHWVSSVTDNGKLVVLEDRSVWEVDAIDTIDTALWLVTEQVTVCGSKMINDTTGGAIGVRRIK
jgi:hypothetical protein